MMHLRTAASMGKVNDPEAAMFVKLPAKKTTDPRNAGEKIHAAFSAMAEQRKPSKKK